MYRSRKDTIKYQPDKERIRLENNKSACPFCDIKSSQVVKKYAGFTVVKNIYGYQYWEFMDVLDHLMIVPKNHIESISEIADSIKGQFMDILVEWEAKGYNIYIRERKCAMKSVPHQHTHLIKTKNVKAKFAIFLRRPYFVFKR